MVPDWVVEADATALCERGVSFSEQALQSLNELEKNSKDSKNGVLLRHSQSVHHLQQLVAQVVTLLFSSDFRPLYCVMFQ